MHAISYTIETLAPILIPANIGELNTVNTLDWIPGRVLLGALASEYLRREGLTGTKTAYQDQNFHQWFQSDALRFTNAYIFDPDHEENTHFPPPLSVQKEKHEKKIDGKEGCILDWLFVSDSEALDTIQTKTLEGFIRLDDTLIESCSVKKSLNFHHARDSKTGTSKEGQIFTYESIDAGQTFQGQILGKEDTLQEFLQCFTPSKLTLYLGRAKNAQYGRVKLTLDSAPSPFDSELENFDCAGKQMSLTLLSDTILYNENGFATTDIKSLEGELLGLKITKSFLKPTVVEQFVSIWKLPRPAECCFKAGSSFLVHVPEGYEERLLDLQRKGIGERRNEGFGRIVFGWQPKHQGIDPSETNFSDENDRPNCDLPDLAKQIAETALKTFIKQQIEVKGLEKADEFNQGSTPSKSLIGRMEAIVGTCKDADIRAYLRQILGKEGGLRRTAQDQLRRCRSKDQTLFEFLSDNERLLPIVRDIDTLSDEIGYDFEADADFQEELVRFYLLTFFAILRKNAAIKGGA